MSRYQDFYNQQREWKGFSNEHNRRSTFRDRRKERRTQVFDLFRGDIAAYKPEEIKPVSQFTFRDAVSKFNREKKNTVIQKPRPFIVGTVKHKIHSPPFLHEAYQYKEPQRKLITHIQKSFAPSNYKFKIPKGLTIMNMETPSRVENPLLSPFLLNTVWNKLDNKNTKKKDFIHDDITHCNKTKQFMEPSSHDFSTENGNAEQKSVKRELWPEASDTEIVFGRLNIKRITKSLNNQPEDNETVERNLPQIEIKDSMSSDSSGKDYDKVKIKNFESIVDLNVESNIASTYKSIQNPDVNTSRIFNEHESETPDSSTQTTQIDCKLSQISSPKTISSNAIDNIGTFIDVFDKNFKSCNSLSSTLSGQNFFKDIPVHSFQNSPNACTSSIISTIQKDLIKECLPGCIASRIEGAKLLNSIVEESQSQHNGLRIKNSNIIESEKTLSDIESLENREKILNLTFTKSLGFIEEDDEEETVRLNLEYLNKEHKRDDNLNNSPVLISLNSSNVNKPIDEFAKVYKAEYNTSNSKNPSLEIENNDNSKEMPSLSKSNLQDDYANQTINGIQKNVVCPRKSSKNIINQLIINPLSGLVSDHDNLDKDENSKFETPVKTISKIIIQYCSSKKEEDGQSQTQENNELVVTSNSMPSNSQILFKDQPTEINNKSVNKNNNKECCASSVSTLTREDENVGLSKTIDSNPAKFIDNNEIADQSIRSLDPSEINIAIAFQAEKEKDVTAETHQLLDSTGTEKSSKSYTPEETSPVNEKQRQLNNSTGLDEPKFAVVTDIENAHTGFVQSHHPKNEVVIDLTYSPIQSTEKKSTKPESQKSALDYKSPLLLLSKQNRNSILSRYDENDVVDLISDDEEDYTSFLTRILQKHVETFCSPKHSPKSRTPLASVGNIPRLCLSQTPQSPVANKIYSPPKKTPMLISETIPMVRVSPAPGPLEILHGTPRKTSRRGKVVKEITEAVEVPSPLRVMNLRNRNISVSPSPNKKTPRVVTPCKTPIKCSLAKEITAEVTEDMGHLRVMNLRSRNVNVSPSPKKKTPRRRKNDKQCA
ncbi:uncharacterized protein LOC131668970 [Phymastichus coffea]|uniref:uncharacterized protein LOC131668970 n=1 Tax=Phymastichus coffea TaxID=108790 RepID=UPI00273CE3FE|nr:uncharacterized protein LOC131668970 [Phymastichus coffea]